MKFNTKSIQTLVQQNWKSGVTVALISLPLSIALSISSGAGPIPGLITGIWATAIAAVFCSNNYNIIGAAGALTTVLFAAQLGAPLGLGPLVLPLLAIATGIILLGVWLIGASRFLYYIPSSVMYGFAAGVAISIAASQLFDATGILAKRTGSFIGDLSLFAHTTSQINIAALSVFLVFLAAIFAFKRFVPSIPAVIPVAVLGVIFGYVQHTFYPLGIQLLADKFGPLQASLIQVPQVSTFMALLSSPQTLSWLFGTAAVIALISILETLITAKLADRITHTQSSSGREIFGLALANIGSGIMGGLPATGVFIRTGANIKAGATHRTSAFIAAIVSALVALTILPLFSYLPAAVVAAILVNIAIGLIEIKLFKELWKYEKSSFIIMVLVTCITVVRNAGDAVAIGAIVALLLFVDRKSHGYFNLWCRFENGEEFESRNQQVLHLPHERKIVSLTYSLAGHVGYIDAGQHAANFRQIAHNDDIQTVVIRMRSLFSIDHEGREMLADAIKEMKENPNRKVYISSASPNIITYLTQVAPFDAMLERGKFKTKTSDIPPAIA